MQRGAQRVRISLGIPRLRSLAGGMPVPIPEVIRSARLVMTRPGWTSEKRSRQLAAGPSLINDRREVVLGDRSVAGRVSARTGR